MNWNVISSVKVVLVGEQERQDEDTSAENTNASNASHETNGSWDSSGSGRGHTGGMRGKFRSKKSQNKFVVSTEDAYGHSSRGYSGPSQSDLMCRTQKRVLRLVNVTDWNDSNGLSLASLIHNIDGDEDSDDEDEAEKSKAQTAPTSTPAPAPAPACACEPTAPTSTVPALPSASMELLIWTRLPFAELNKNHQKLFDEEDLMVSCEHEQPSLQEFYLKMVTAMLKCKQEALMPGTGGFSIDDEDLDEVSRRQEQQWEQGRRKGRRLSSALLTSPLRLSSLGKGASRKSE